MEIIAGITAALGLSKQLLDFTTAANDASAKHAAAELQMQLAELKVKLADLIEENDTLKRQLKKATSTEQEVTLKNGLYYKPDGDGPYCTSCYDGEKKLIRVTAMAKPFNDSGNWRCNVCKNHYQ